MTTIKDLPQKKQCPYCQQNHVKRDGSTIKGAQRFFCYNCKRYWQGTYLRSTLRAFREQQELFAWAAMHPNLINYLLMISDVAGQEKSEKNDLVNKQVCNVLLAYPMNDCHGLWIKLKNKSSKLDSEINQPAMQALQAVGYAVKIANGWQEAAKEIKGYLGYKL